ncbi:MAG TPA: hypothetical protein VFB72_11260 [Verrucomicrobiae bacterium]|nr:hypothetical protein [Verrucomicrobiae bacterium]
MKRKIFLCALGIAAVLATSLCFADPIDPTTELGAAGPSSLAILDNGNFSISFNPATVIINGQPVVEGEINGNLADNAGNISTSTSGQLLGQVYLGPTASGVSGANVHTGSSVPATDLAIAFGAGGAAQYYNGLTPAITTAPSAGAVAPGVYSLSSWNISGGTYTLTAGKVYVFNITGDFTLNQAAQFLDSTPGDVIFNVGGKVSTSGGLNNPGEVEIDGVVMAQGSISLTPGYVIPELISDTSINIASGGGVNGGTPPPTAAPDTASSLVLLGFGAGLLFLAKAKLAGKRA